MLDDLDLNILQELQRDGRASHRTMAATLGTSTPTIGARVERLKEAGILRGVRADIAPNAVSGVLWAILLRAPAPAHGPLLAALDQDGDVERVLALSGGRMLALVRTADPGAIGPMEARLAEQGATDLDAWAVTDIPVERPPDLARHRAVATCGQCRGPIHGEGESSRLGGRRVWFCCLQCKKTFLTKHSDMERKAKNG